MGFEFKEKTGEVLEKKAVDFLKNTCKDDKVMVIGHSDGDGLCSIAIICEFLERKGVSWKRRVLFDSERTNLEKETRFAFEEFKPTKLIMVDFPVQGKITDFIE
ncbi:MAG: hypothetical protein KAS30_04335, partial [Candidatus Diapherotrites archaeon]|nr:hypothetical protein [Candidatus Diapherotrites archaeon]